MILKSNKSFGEVFIPQSRFKGIDKILFYIDFLKEWSSTR